MQINTYKSAYQIIAKSHEVGHLHGQSGDWKSSAGSPGPVDCESTHCWPASALVAFRIPVEALPLGILSQETAERPNCRTIHTQAGIKEMSCTLTQQHEYRPSQSGSEHPDLHSIPPVVRSARKPSTKGRQATSSTPRPATAQTLGLQRPKH